MRAQRKIDVEQAEIKTTTVEIKSLMVNARKMTLSVFRQIPEQNLLILDGDKLTLAGVPWGQVNYYWGDQFQSGLHILWQQGKELKRSIVIPEGMSRYHVPRVLRDVENETDLDICKSESALKAYWMLRRENKDSLNSFSNFDRVLDDVNEGVFDGNMRSYRFTWHGMGDKNLEADVWGKVNHQLQELIDLYSSSRPAHDKALERRGLVKASYQEQYDNLAALDQLFIAV